MTDGVFMSSELEDKIDMSEEKDEEGPYEPEHQLFAVLMKGGKKSKPVRVGRYEECTENSRLTRKLELFLTREEFCSVAESRPDGFALLLPGDVVLFNCYVNSQAQLRIDAVGSPDTYSHVWLTF